MDGGQLEKGVKYSKFSVHIVIPLFQLGLKSHPNTLMWSFAVNCFS